MKDKHLHIIAFDIPYPADYGGVMDIYYKIQALHEVGVKVILHAYQYRERKPHEHLAALCEKVYYYQRELSPLSMLGEKPYIVTSRRAKLLLKNLLKDDFPILFEGLHTCYWIENKKLENRIKIVRLHNIEWEYYRNLQQIENKFWKKIYFKTESFKLKNYEKDVLQKANFLLTISRDDTDYYEEMSEKMGIQYNKTLFIPPFHPNETVESQTGRSEYVLFHGKLSVSDNEQVALYLIKKIFSKIDIPLSIAGKNPSEALLNAALPYENIKIIANPDEKMMQGLIQNAQINVLLSFQRSGMKLKLLNALFRGRYCIVNRHMIQNTGLESFCYIKNTSKDIAATIESLMNVQFSQKQIDERKVLLEKGFSNYENALKIVELI